MTNFFEGAGVIFSLEMRQRVRGRAWYVLLGVFFGLVVLVTAIVTFVFHAYDTADTREGSEVYSTIIYFVLLLGVLVAPALSGNAINGDRDAGTLATTQVTLVSGWQIVFGKFLAAWVTGLAFLAVSVPALIYAVAVGGISAPTIIVSLVILAVELGVVSAIGVAFSGIITRPLFSIVLTYLTVAALCIGTLIAFTLGGLAIETQTTTKYYSSEQTDKSGNNIHCTYVNTDTQPTPRFDLVWGVLAANPFVILADAVPASYDHDGQPKDLFGDIKYGVRSAQITPPSHQVENDCDTSYAEPSPRHVIETTTPGWLVGLIVHLVLAGGGLFLAGRSLRSPAGRLPRGSRVA